MSGVLPPNNETMDDNNAPHRTRHWVDLSTEQPDYTTICEP